MGGEPTTSGAGRSVGHVDRADALAMAEKRRQPDDPPAQEPVKLDLTSLDLGGDVVFVTDRDGTILDVNDAFVRVTGYSRAEAIGATPRLLSSGFQDGAFYQDLWETILAGNVWEGQLIDRRRDGLLRSHRATISPVRDETGQVTHFVAVERDLSGELGRHLATGSTGLLHTDVGARCTYADARAAALLDRPPAELLGPGFLAALVPDDADEVRDVIQMAIERGREHRLDVRTTSGRWLHLETTPLSAASGTIIGATVSVEDVSESVAMHRELARRDAFVDSVLDALEEAVAVLGPDGRVLAVNRAWRERAEEAADDALIQLRVGDDLLAQARRVASEGDDRARLLLEDLQLVMTGIGRRRRRGRSIQVSQLGWEEGGAVLRLL